MLGLEEVGAAQMGNNGPQKKARGDPERQNSAHQCSVTIVCDPVCEANVMPQEGFALSRIGSHLQAGFQLEAQQEGHRTVSGQESNRTAAMADGGRSIRFQTGPELSVIEPAYENNSSSLEAAPEVEAAPGDESTIQQTLRKLAESVTGVSWNPELKLLRILQGSDDEDDDTQASGAQSEESLAAWAESITEEALSRAGWSAARGSRPSS